MPKKKQQAATKIETSQPEAVLQLAAMGLRVHPLLKRNKVPIVKQWQTKATTDEVQIRKWHAINIDCNWGVATGVESGVFVIDIDPKAGGDKSWAKLIKVHGAVDTPTVITGTGGRHIYFKYPSKLIVRNSASKVGKGIDVRGDNGQVVVPFSIHPNGTAYQWEKNKSPFDLPFAKAPKWLIDILKQNSDIPDAGTIGDKMLKGTRNDAIYSQALSLAERGTDRDFTIATMKQWCKTTGETDITDDEIEMTVASAYKYAESRKASKVTTEIELTDKGNADRMIALAGNKMKYVIPIGWHIWDGKCWQPDMEELSTQNIAVEAALALEAEIREEIGRTTDRGRANVLYKMMNFAMNSRNIGKVKAAVDSARYNPAVFALQSSMDDDRSTYLLNVANGVLDLRTGELKPHDPNLLLTKVSPTAYNPKAKCPHFLQTMKYAFNGDKEMIAYMQRALGYSISGSLNEQCFFICYGPAGANGKSTILEAVHMVLGEGIYAKTSSAETITSSKNGTSSTTQSSLASLRKIRFVSVNEFSASATVDEELMKRLTGGDSIEARFLYKEVFTYMPSFKIWIRANNEPIVRDTGDAFWRRLKKIPFEYQIPKEKRKGSTEMKDILAKEAEGILAWMVQGFQDWYKNGLQEPQKVIKAGAEYRNDSDIFAQFIEDNIIIDANEHVERRKLYRIFVEWCNEQGIRYVMTNKRFSNGMAEKLNQHKQLKHAGIPVWKGIKLNAEASMNSMAY